MSCSNFDSRARWHQLQFKNSRGVTQTIELQVEGDILNVAMTIRARVGRTLWEGTFDLLTARYVANELRSQCLGFIQQIRLLP